MAPSLTLRLVRPTLMGAAAGFATAAGTFLTDELVGNVVQIPTGNARAALAAAFGAVVTVGAFSFWMRPIAAQLAASAIPPQLLANHLHDRFQARIIAATVGVLGFLAVTLLALPSAADDPAPSISTIVGMLLATGAFPALLIAMYQAERSTRPHAIVAESAQHVIRRIQEAAVDRPVAHAEAPDEAPATIVAADSGWVTRIDMERLLDEVPSGATVRLETHVGAFVVGGWTEVASVWPIEAVDADRHARMSSSVEIGDQRSDASDLVGSMNRFLDIGVHAATASGGAPSTVEQAMSWVGAVLHELVRHGALDYPDLTTEDRRTIVQDGVPSGPQLADLVVDRLRRATASDDARTSELSRIVADAEEAARHIGHDDVADALRRQLVVMNGPSRSE